MTDLPLQPIYRDAYDTIRFRSNPIVRHLLDHGGIDLNQLAMLHFTQADREQFYQLIGYSLCGYHELSEVSDESATRASVAARETLDLPRDQSVGCRDNQCVIHCGVPVETPNAP